MNYLSLPHLDDAVSVFDICQAHAQLESDYNVGGILRERESNRRRNASTGWQLHRMKYTDCRRWVEICKAEEPDEVDYSDEAVRDIYLMNVLKMGLPMDDEMRNFIAARYVPDFLDSFDSWRKAGCTPKPGETP